MQNNYCYAPELSAYPPSSTYTFPTSGDSWTYDKSYKLDLFLPEQSDWECELFGTGQSLVLRPNKDKVPNWFWRQMQYLCFGNKWKKIKE